MCLGGWGGWKHIISSIGLYFIVSAYIALISPYTEYNSSELCLKFNFSNNMLLKHKSITYTLCGAQIKKSNIWMIKFYLQSLYGILQTTLNCTKKHLSSSRDSSNSSQRKKERINNKWVYTSNFSSWTREPLPVRCTLHQASLAQHLLKRHYTLMMPQKGKINHKSPSYMLCTNNHLNFTYKHCLLYMWIPNPYTRCNTTLIKTHNKRYVKDLQY